MTTESYPFRHTRVMLNRVDPDVIAPKEQLRRQSKQNRVTVCVSGHLSEAKVHGKLGHMIKTRGPFVL